MSGKSTYRRKHGVYFTPDGLARGVVSPLLNGRALAVLDPACGGGALLAAARDVLLSQSGAQGRQLALYGCDKFRCRSLAESVPEAQFVQQDFMEYQPGRQFDLVVTNPPFVRSQEIDKEAQERYRDYLADECPVSGQADLWAYFIVKASTHLKQGGCLGAILPWSLLQAGYAADIRRWLASSFGSIRVLLLTNEHFDGTTKRVLIAWLRGYGRPVKSVEMGCSARLHDECGFFAVSRSQWERAPFAETADVRVEELLESCKSKHGFTTLGRLADIRIGVVTGADSYFILTKQQAKDNGFHHANLLPILTSSRELGNLVSDTTDCRKFLLKLGRAYPERYEEYLGQGADSGIDKRTHPARRDPWYSIDPGPAPDAFFHYRVSSTPFLVLNPGGLQSTNSIHRVYFDGLSASEQRWVQISLLSVFGQLSLEARGRTYGKGVLKVEPSALKSALCYQASRRLGKDEYEEICSLIARGEKGVASHRATDLVVQETDIPDEMVDDARTALEELRNRRISW